MTEVASGSVTYTWTGPPNVVWVQRPPVMVMVLMAVTWGCLCAFVATFVAVDHGYRRPAELTAAEKAAPNLVERTWPTKMILRILPQEEFERLRGESDVIAFTYPNFAPCVINLPEGWEIAYSPSIGRAHFVNYDNGSILAHEMLHCLRGSWHPEWSTIKAARR